MAVSDKTMAMLLEVSTAAITTVLLKKGLRNIWLRGTLPLRQGQPRVAGPAFTMRFIPMREDLATPAAWSHPVSTRSAIEAMPENSVIVVDALGVKDVGIFGDILCSRMKKRGAAGLVTDGMIRDLPGVLATGLPVWCQGAAAPASVNGLTFVNWQEPIACGGVAVLPGDIVVMDDDGAVVIPQNLVEDVAQGATAQEAFDLWVLEEIENGAALPGLYPPNAETNMRYERLRAMQK